MTPTERIEDSLKTVNNNAKFDPMLIIFALEFIFELLKACQIKPFGELREQCKKGDFFTRLALRRALKRHKILHPNNYYPKQTDLVINTILHAGSNATDEEYSTCLSQHQS